MTETSTESPANADSWEGMLANLRNRYPGQKDSVLFCIHKLHQNQDLGLPDFREEAALYGIPMAGRALHSAKVILGLAKAKPRTPKQKPASQPREASTPVAAAETPSRKQRSFAAGKSTSIEAQVLAAVRQIQSDAGEDSARLRAAIRQAIAILQRALDD